MEKEKYSQTEQKIDQAPQPGPSAGVSDVEKAPSEEFATLSAALAAKEAALNEAKATIETQSADLAALRSANESAISEAKKTLDAQAADIATLKEANGAAVTAYRKLAVSSNPIFTDELITGSTVQEVDAAMTRVSGLAAGIKTRLEEELKATIIPAGAPGRTGPDTSGLSAREKIKAGLGK